MIRGRSQDGMSWLRPYAPAPTVEGICDQCAAAAQRPHEARTLSQWRVDIASAMLLNQSLAENRMFVPTDLAWTALLAEAVSGAAPGTVELVAPEPVHATNLCLPS